MTSDNEVTLTVGGAGLSGWTDVRITRRIEGCPDDFQIGFTERYPGEPDDFLVQAGNPCTLAIGGDTVITGYVDRYTRSYNKDGHTVSITGRGKTQDLVDCSAEYKGGQISGALLDIATALCKPYGITVSSLATVALPTIPQFNLTLGETAFDIIERICRYAGVLAYEGTDGNLILANTQSTQAASGFVEGVNVEAASVTSAMDQRYSEVDAMLLGMDTLADAGNGGNLIGEAKDPFVPRHRKIYIIAESGGGGKEVCLKRANWEVARRTGRAYNAEITTDSWRDSAGTLWTPNTQAPIDLPGLKLTDKLWTLGTVTYRMGEEGRLCDVVAMDPSAFQPEPILLLPEYPDVNPGNASGG